MDKIQIVEIFCLGNEILIGRTINKNATDIAFSLSQMGYKITRVTTVRDELIAASNAFKDILSRQPDIVVVSGGLGPTFDDIQLEVIATATNRKLVLNEIALEMIAKHYRVDKNKVPEAGKKMAKLPEHSIPLNNSKGTAPGVRLHYNNITIFCLPGVPIEMKAILNEEVIPYLKKENMESNTMVEFGFSLRGVGESKIIDVTKNIMAEFPHVNFKSHPRRDKTGYWLSLQTYLITENADKVKVACERWRKALLQNFDIQVTEVKPVFDEHFKPE